MLPEILEVNVYNHFLTIPRYLLRNQAVLKSVMTSTPLRRTFVVKNNNISQNFLPDTLNILVNHMLAPRCAVTY